MTRAPDAIVFVCEGCRKVAKPAHIQQWLGQCKKCGGQTWQLVTSYTDLETETSSLSLFSALTTGVSWDSVVTSTNERIATGVSADVAMMLTQQKSEIPARVSGYLRLRDQEELRQRGAQKCKACGALFVPTEGKAWTQHGFCSKMCGAGTGSAVAPAPVRPKPVAEPKQTISVKCVCGHEFGVLRAFSGCTRPCPSCGTKCAVP